MQIPVFEIKDSYIVKHKLEYNTLYDFGLYNDNGFTSYKQRMLFIDYDIARKSQSINAENFEPITINKSLNTIDYLKISYIDENYTIYLDGKLEYEKEWIKDTNVFNYIRPIRSQEFKLITYNYISTSTSIHPRWNDSNDINIYGTDLFNFNALPSGYKNNDGQFSSIGDSNLTWCSDYINTDAYYIIISSGSSDIPITNGYKTRGLSIRIVRSGTTEEQLLYDGTIIPNTFTDNDGNLYDGTKIGTQIWTTKNLHTTTYAHSYENNSIKYGRLYNWYASTDVRNVAPIGWHVPTFAEWSILITFIGGTYYGGKLKEANFNNWDNGGTIGTDDYGFKSLPNGYTYNSLFYNGPNSGINNRADYITIGDSYLTTFRNIVIGSDNTIGDSTEPKNIGKAIRCIRDSGNTGTTVTDIDGNNYTSVTIGTQTWLAENLSVTHYQNGDPILQNFTGTVGAYANYNNDENNVYYLNISNTPSPIPSGLTNTQWSTDTSGATTVYNDISTEIINKTIKYGRLYNLYATTDLRGIAPTGWHVPTGDEWNTLRNYLGGYIVAGGKLKELGTEHWQSPNSGATNETLFTALPGGVYNGYGFSGNYDTGFTQMGTFARFHAGLTPNGDQYRHDFNMYYNGTGLSDYTSVNYKIGLSVRLIKDNGINEGDIIIDGDTYHAVTIGTQVWLQQNLSVTHYQNGDPILSDFNGFIGAVIAYNNDENNVYNYISTGTYEMIYTPVDELLTKEDMVNAYGRLYNWYTITNNSILIDPTDGWHVPDSTEFQTLSDYLTTTYPTINSSNIGNVLKSVRQVNSPYMQPIPQQINYITINDIVNVEIYKKITETGTTTWEYTSTTPNELWSISGLTSDGTQWIINGQNTILGYETGTTTWTVDSITPYLRYDSKVLGVTQTTVILEKKIDDYLFNNFSSDNGIYYKVITNNHCDPNYSSLYNKLKYNPYFDYFSYDVNLNSITITPIKNNKDIYFNYDKILFSLYTIGTGYTIYDESGFTYSTDFANDTEIYTYNFNTNNIYSKYNLEYMLNQFNLRTDIIYKGKTSNVIQTETGSTTLLLTLDDSSYYQIGNNVIIETISGYTYNTYKNLIINNISGNIITINTPISFGQNEIVLYIYVQDENISVTNYVFNNIDDINHISFDVESIFNYREYTYIQVNTNTGNTYNVIISNISGNTITIITPLNYLLTETILTISNIKTISEISNLLDITYENYNRDEYRVLTIQQQRKIYYSYAEIINKEFYNQEVRLNVSGLIFENENNIMTLKIFDPSDYKDPRLLYEPTEIVRIGKDRKTSIPIIVKDFKLGIDADVISDNIYSIYLFDPNIEDIALVIDANFS